jgi:hypothetical protein
MSGKLIATWAEILGLRGSVAQALRDMWRRLMNCKMQNAKCETQIAVSD